MSDPQKLRVTLVKSPIGCLPKHRATVRALGLRRMHKSKEYPFSPSLAGMLRQVSHLLQVEELR